MKNIYNLITDAFSRMGENESNYTIKVDFTESTLKSYTVSIKLRNAENTAGSASVIIIADLSDNFLYYDEENTLFEDWDKFCEVLDFNLEI